MLPNLAEHADRLATAVSHSPLRAIWLATGSGASGAAPILTHVSHATLVIQLLSAIVGLAGASVGLYIGILALRKRREDDAKVSPQTDSRA